LASLYAAVGCGGDDTLEFGTGGSAVPGDAAGDHPDSGPSASGGTGGSTALPDSSADAASEGSVAMPDVSTDDGAQAGEVRVPDGGVESEADAVNGMSTDASGETLAEAEPSDAAIADAPDDSPHLSRICALGCVTTDDCRADASTSKLVCDPVGHRCVSCIDDMPCIAVASQWSKTCAADGDCGTLFGDYCVDVGGFGYCAFDSAKIGTASCFGNASSYPIKKHAGSEMVSVCAKLTSICDLRRGRCEGPCTITCVSDGAVCTNTCTVTRGGTICNAATKRCECASDNDCAAPLGHCNPVTLQCECASGNACAPDGGSALVCK
jgi:hypothetical protein